MMKNNDNPQGYSLMFVIVNQGKGSKILQAISEMGICGAAAFYGRGTVPNHILKFLELADVRKEVVMVAMSSSDEQKIVNALIDKFSLNRPNKGIIFTLPLSAVYGRGHHYQGPAFCPREGTPWQAVMTIVDKGNTDKILDYVDDHGFPRGTVIDAHGSADKSNKFFNLMFESEKDLLLMITPREQASPLADLLTDHLNLNQPNSGILALFNLHQAAGITLPSQEERSFTPGPIKGCGGYSAIFIIIENDKDEAVIQSAERAGSTGGTIIHARSICSYYGKNFLSHGVEEEREIIFIIAEDEKTQAISQRVSDDLGLGPEGTGKGIILVAPLCSVIGLAPEIIDK